MSRLNGYKIKPTRQKGIMFYTLVTVIDSI